MKLKTLLKDLPVVVKGSKEVEITGLSSDSRTVSPGNLFLAKKGSLHDGTQFIAQAMNAGAAAIATDIYDPFLQKTQVIHPDVSQIEAVLASRYYGDPSSKLFMVGVTGTKGKTTTSYIIKYLLDGLKKKCGLIGTIETYTGVNRFFSKLTTSDLISNQKYLKEMVLSQCKAAVMEVSSHGLAQGRVEGIDFDLGLFTNLYPDHLDYHKTMEEYAAAKKKLFAKCDRAIVNADSFWGDCEGFSFGIEKGDVRAVDLKCTSKGTEFSVDGCRFFSPLIGRFNIYNVLGAIAVGLQLGHRLDEMKALLFQFPGVPGRMQRIGNVFVDFAHTGEALESVLQTLKEIARGRVIVVFGCGGERDPQRRGGMAKAAEKWADLSIVTSDNPRREDPQEIARQIIKAFQKEPRVELDRKKAIELAISLAKPDDFILIAGKGHEQGQIFASQTIPFDDAAVVKEALQNLGKSAIVVPS